MQAEKIRDIAVGMGTKRRWDQRLETFLHLHERAFRDLGGVARLVRRDNLRAAVVRACLCGPESH